MGYKERSVHRAREKLGLAVRQSGFGKDKRSTWTWGDNIVSATIVPCVPNKIPGMNGTYGGKNDGNSEIEVEV